MVWETKTTQVYEEHYLQNHRHEEQALRWVATQHALNPRHGHGVYTLDATNKLIHNIRTAAKVKQPTAAVKKLVDQLDELFHIEPISEPALQDRERAITEGDASDLPSGSVRAIRLRLLNWKRKTTAFHPNAAKRIIKMIRCGQQTQTQRIDQNTGEVTTGPIDTYVCKVPGCARPMCHAQWTRHKKTATRTAINKIKEQDPTATPVLITLKTPWPLPKNERRRTQLHPILATLGRSKPRLTRPEPMAQEGDLNLTEERLTEHEQHRTKFVHNQVVRRTVANNTHYTTETSFLMPSQPEHRSFPNPHSHLVSAIPHEMSIERFALILQKQWRTITQMNQAQVFVAPLYPDDADLDDDSEDEEALDNYLRKTASITEDQPDPSGFKPKPHDLASTLDDRSLSEWLDLLDFQRPRKSQGSFNYQNQERRPRRVYGAGTRFKNLDEFFHMHMPRPKHANHDTKEQGISFQGAKDTGSVSCVREPEPLVGDRDSENQDTGLENGLSSCVREPEPLVGDREPGIGREKPQAEHVPSGRQDHSARSEPRDTNSIGALLQSRVVPLGRLLDELRHGGGVTQWCDGSYSTVLGSADVEGDSDQGPSPTDWMEEDEEEFIPSNQYVGLIDEHLINDLLLTCEQGDGARKLKGLRLLIEPDDDLDGIDGCEVFCVDAESSLPGVLIPGGGCGSDTGSDDDGCLGPSEVEQVLTGSAEKAGCQVGLGDEVGREHDVERLGGGERRSECECDGSVARRLVQQQRVAYRTSRSAEQHLTIDEYRQKTLRVACGVNDVESEWRRRIEGFGDAAEVFVSVEDSQDGEVGNGFLDDDGRLRVEQCEHGKGERSSSGREGDGHRGRELATGVDEGLGAAREHHLVGVPRGLAQRNATDTNRLVTSPDYG